MILCSLLSLGGEFFWGVNIHQVVVGVLTRLGCRHHHRVTVRGIFLSWHERIDQQQSKAYCEEMSRGWQAAQKTDVTTDT